MLSALGVTVAGPAAVSSKCFVFWPKDMHGGKSDVVLQEKYNAISESERNRCDWLQKVTNQFLLYYMEKILGALFMTTIKDLYSVAVDDGQNFVWQGVTDHVRKRLFSHDAF